MSLAQRFFTAIFPKRWTESMEADSRAWKVRCPNCEHERSVWEMGGIRWKAYGNPRWFLRCSSCGGRHWHKVYKAGTP